MIGNGAKQNPDTHQKKGWSAPARRTQGKGKGKKVEGKREREGETEVFGV
jgi:hypothetical protein